MQNIFLKDGNTPYCGYRSYVVIVARHDEPRATENPPTSPAGIDFPGLYKITILFAKSFAVPENGTAINRHPLITPKGITEPKFYFGFCLTIGKIIALSECINPITFPVRDIGEGRPVVE